MDTKHKNIFEKIIDREIPANILEETNEYIIIEDINKKAPIHVLIIPKKNIPSISSAENSDTELLGELLLVAKNFAKKNDINHGFRLVINDGMQAGQTVPHLHIHLFAGKPMVWPPC